MEGRYDAGEKDDEGTYQAVPGISHAAGMFARRKSPLAEVLLPLPGPGVSPASVFRISVKDILKHCWPILSERSDNWGLKGKGDFNKEAC